MNGKVCLYRSFTEYNLLNSLAPLEPTGLVWHLVFNLLQYKKVSAKGEFSLTTTVLVNLCKTLQKAKE